MVTKRTALIAMKQGVESWRGPDLQNTSVKLTDSHHRRLVRHSTRCHQDTIGHGKREAGLNTQLDCSGHDLAQGQASETPRRGAEVFRGGIRGLQ